MKRKLGIRRHTRLVDDGKPIVVSWMHQHDCQRDSLDPIHRQKMAAFDKVDKPTGSSNEDVATLPQFIHLLAGWSTAITDTRSKHRAIAETTSLVEYLG